MARASVDVVGIGLNSTDTVLRLARYPERGEKTAFRTVDVLPGGQVATAMIACASWGLRTRYVGRLGDDPAAALHRREFERFGIDAKLVTTPECPSRQSFLLVDDGGERTIVGTEGDRGALKPGDLQRNWITDARVLHVDGYDTDVATTAATWAREAGVPVVADLDEPYEGLESLLERVDFVVTNHSLPERLTGHSDPRRALRAIRDGFGNRLVAMTMGAAGVLAWDGAELVAVPGFRVDVVDTTGAGDLFHAGFTYGLLQGWPLRRQLEFACAAAALNCTALGARGAIRPLGEVEALIRSGSRTTWNDAETLQIVH